MGTSGALETQRATSYHATMKTSDIQGQANTYVVDLFYFIFKTSFIP